MRAFFLIVAILALLVAAVGFISGNREVEPVQRAIVEKNQSEDDHQVDSELHPAERKVIIVPSRQEIIIRKADLHFPDGSVVPVTLRTDVAQESSVPETELIVESYDALVDAAHSGDAAAARILYRTMKYCSESYPDSQSLDSAMREMRENGILRLPHTNTAEKLPQGLDVSSMERMYRRQYDRCKGITEENTAEFVDWARLSAEGGDFRGLRYLTEELGNTKESFDLWQQAWTNGYASALQAISLSYGQGVPDSANGKPDYVNAYAYQLAYFKITLAAYAKNDVNMVATIDDVLSRMGGELSPNEQRRAEFMAMELVKSNPRCCFVGYVVPESGD